MTHFLMQLHPPRPSFPSDMNDAEKSVMDSHVAYWHGLTVSGRALCFGPVFGSTGIWGLGILATSDVGNASAIANADPAIVAGIGFTFDLFPAQLHFKPV